MVLRFHMMDSQDPRHVYNHIVFLNSVNRVNFFIFTNRNNNPWKGACDIEGMFMLKPLKLDTNGMEYNDLAAQQMYVRVTCFSKLINYHKPNNH